MRDKIRGSLFGGAVGDALGYPVEFLRSSEIFRRYGEKGIGDYQPQSGQALISDDTQMSLFTACGILYGDTRLRMRGMGAPMSTYIYEAYLDWLSTQRGVKPEEKVSWLCNVPALYSLRAPGNASLSALSSGQMGTIKKPINNSKGCGGIMRVAPVALYFQNTGTQDKIGYVDKLGAAAAAITHGHPLGWLLSAALVHVIRRLVYGGCTTGEGLRDILRECEDTLLDLFGDGEDMRKLFRLIAQAEKLAENDRPDVENIEKLGGGWVAEETLAIALYCCLRYPDDFDKALIASVNHGGDSDSTGAVAGNIMGAICGYDSIAEKWKAGLELKDVILEIADDLADGCRISEDDDDTDEKWAHKYIHCDYAPERE